MPAKNLLRVDREGTYSHIYNKGVETRIIFGDDEDYQVFIDYLQEYINPTLDPESKKKTFVVKGKTYRGTPHQPKNYFNKVELIAYSLTPTHFHLVLHQVVQGSIQSFLRSLTTRYSMYYNRKYQRQGALFEGPYKSVHLTDPKLLLDFVVFLRNSHPENKHSLINTEPIVDLFGDSDNIISGLKENFDSFSEKYVFDSDQKNSLDKLMLENTQKDVAITSSQLIQAPVPLVIPPLPIDSSIPLNNEIHNPPKTRLPEYISLCFLFVMFVGFGIRNISVSATDVNHISKVTSIESHNKVSDLSTNSQEVNTMQSELKTEVSSMSGVNKTPDVLSASDSALDLVYSPVKVDKGVGFVQIYSKPSKTSEVHMTVEEGEHFLGAPFNKDWYEIRLNNNTTGFIPSNYVILDQNTN